MALRSLVVVWSPPAFRATGLREYRLWEEGASHSHRIQVDALERIATAERSEVDA